MPVIRTMLVAFALNHSYLTPTAFRIIQADGSTTAPEQAVSRQAAMSELGQSDAYKTVLSPENSVKGQRVDRQPQRHFLVAVGYGKRVPLRFAVRQIVPHGVIVTFSPDVDTEARVDWQGGREWNKVLASTVRQIGDVIDVGRNKVTIRRQNR